VWDGLIIRSPDLNLCAITTHANPSNGQLLSAFVYA
jgi:hypothetical protein